MNPTNPCKDLGLSLLYLSMHPFSSVMPIGTKALGSFPPKLFQNQPPNQPQLLAPLPNSHDCWCWAMGLHTPMWLSPTQPLLPNLVSQPQSHVPLACGPVHCPCALPVCTLPVCTLPGCVARVRCLGTACACGLGTTCARYLGALSGRSAWARGQWALPVRAAWALCLCARPGRCLCVQPVGVTCARSLCARFVGAACARSLGALNQIMAMRP